MNEVKIQWHSGFVAAMDLEFSANRNDLTYEREYNLNTKPLEIDLLVIKKDQTVQVENEIGRIFRGHNILEYKSPEDHLDIDTFYKSEAYAALYKSYGDTVDERRADDITVSIVREAKPEGLFRYFKDHGIRVESSSKGIYHIQEKVPFSTQIIVTRELEGESHTWLKALSDKLKKEQLKSLLECTEGLKLKVERELADAVLEVSIRANQKVVEELKGDESVCQALLEIMEPEISKIVGEATEKVRKETEERVQKETEKRVQKETEERVQKETEKRQAVDTAKKMISSGKFSAKEIIKYVSGISIEEVMTLEKELAHTRSI
ncbi:MAG: hypothetical protein HFG76_01390 [Hungatella sp.]|nr:hypothetical protein [Hungatella sp.]